ncbi:MAG: hypothetical protein ABSG40_06705 [Terriglobales bacterium]|jgi:predicted transcriptional regulator
MLLSSLWKVKLTQYHPILTLGRNTVVMKKITFSADENKIELAREVARSEHKTLNDAFRDWLNWYGSRKVSRVEIAALFEKLKYADAGRRFTRDEMNER